MRSISLFFRSVTKSLLLVSFLTAAAVSSANAQDAAAGAAIFKQKCTACHGIGKVVVGPDLKGINDRQSEEWLIKWIKNAPALIASGDPAAKEAEKFSPAMMSAFPELTDDDIKGVLAYIKAEESKPAAAAAAPGAAGAEGGSGGISNFMIFGLIAVIIIAFIVIVVLNRVIRTLERVMLEKQGVVVEEEEVQAGDRFAGLKKLSKNKKFILFIVLLVVIFLGSAGWMGMWNTGVHTGYQPVQPIKFSHQLHAGLNKIDC